MTEYKFDYSEYGLWNGKPTLPLYNREEKRKNQIKKEIRYEYFERNFS